jgi:hypothetical protein
MLTYGLKSPRDLLEKLKRDGALLNEEVTSDKFFNFVATGWAIKDWVKNDESLPTSARSIVESSAQNDQLLQICRDLANASKHFVLSRSEPIISTAESAQGYGLGRYGKGRYGYGEEDIQITLNDGSAVSCLELVKGVILSWDRFFLSHGL